MSNQNGRRLQLPQPQVSNAQLMQGIMAIAEGLDRIQAIVLSEAHCVDCSKQLGSVVRCPSCQALKAEASEAALQPAGDAVTEL